MAQRSYPEEFFATRRQVQTQEPVHVMYLQTEPVAVAAEPLNPNMTLAIVGIIALVGILGLFALLGSNRKCDK